MKIAIQMIREELNELVEQSFIHSDKMAGVIESVSYFEPTLVTNEETIYIVPAQNLEELLFETRAGAFLILIDEKEPLTEKQIDQLENLENDVLLLRETSVIRIFQRIQSILDKYNQWELELYRTCAVGKSVQEIAQTATHLIKNPFFIYSAAMKLIFCGNLTETAENFFNEIEDYETQFVGKYLPEIYMDKLSKRPVKRQKESVPYPVISDSEALGYRTLSYNVFLNHTYVARTLICEVENPLLDSDAFVLKTLGDFLAPHLDSHDVGVNSHPANFDKGIYQLLDGKPVENEQAFLTAMDAFGWVEKDTYLCSYIAIDKKVMSVDQVMKVCVALETECLGSAVLTFEDHLVHIVNRSMVSDQKKQVINSLHTMYTQRNLKVGISPVFIGLKQLPERCKQGEKALLLGEAEKSGDGFYRYERYALKDMAQIVNKEYSIHTICPYEIAKLMEYDENRRMHLTETLKTYLENDRNIARSIRLLHMQRATFLYQLNRIEEITGLDLDDAGVRLYLRFYFSAKEMLEIE